MSGGAERGNYDPYCLFYTALDRAEDCDRNPDRLSGSDHHYRGHGPGESGRAVF